MAVRFFKNNQSFDSEECNPNLNLLAHAQILELEIGSTCGGHGKCAGDRIVLNTENQLKVNPHTEIEKFHLSKEELMSGMRLACQCFPNSDSNEILVKVVV